MSSFQVPAVFKAIDRITAPMKVMERGVVGFARKTEVAIGRAERKFIGLGRSINKAAGGFGLFLGATAVFGVVASGVGVIADYEQANANLASVLGKNVSQTVALQQSSQKLGATTAFTASEVAGLQTEYAKLGFTESQILKVSKATLDLAAATTTELPQAASQVGAAIKAFGLEASDAGRVANVFAASTSKSALDMEKLQVSMSKVAPVAKQFGFSIEDTVSLMGSLSDAGFDASTMATSTRSILLNLADSNGKLAKALGKPARNITEVTNAMIKMREKGIDLSKMLGLTDKRSVAAFGTFLEGAEKIQLLNKQVTGTSAASQMAATQLDTLKGRATILNSAWQGLLISTNEGNSAFMDTAKRVLEVTTEVLLLAGGMQQAVDTSNKFAASNRSIAETIITVLKWTKRAVIGYLALKAVILVTRTAYAAYSIALGVNAAIQGKSLFALRANMLAMRAQLVVTKLVTAAQWLWNAAMTANPIGLIIASVAALLALVTAIIVKWDEWGAAVSLFLGPIGLVISLVQAFRRNWQSIVSAFQNNGILAGLKAIGITILDSVLMPLEQLLGLINKFTGLDLGFSAVANLRTRLDESLGDAAGSDTVINPEAARERLTVERSESTESKTVDININDPSGMAEVEDGNVSDGISVSTESGIKRIAS